MAILKTVNKKTKDGLEVSIETPLLSDAAELLEVARRIMNESKHLLTQGDEFTFTVETQEKRMRDFREHLAHHGMIGVSFVPEFTGKGLGRLMMTELINWAKENPRVETLRLQVHATNAPAVALYEKLGFKVEGREVKGIKLENGQYDDVLTMALFV